MSIRTKLEFNNQIINDTNQNLLVIKNAFIRPASDFGKIDTSDANATQEDILSGKIAYVNGTKYSTVGAFLFVKKGIKILFVEKSRFFVLLQFI